MNKKAAKNKIVAKKPEVTKKPATKVNKKITPKATPKAVSANVRKNTPAAADQKLTKKQIEYFKTKLETEKNRVLEEMTDLQKGSLKTSISDASGENSRYSYHLGDVASLSYGREFDMGLSERQQKYLEQIDEALQRIEDGTYGICKVTGEPISIERLEEVPVAKYSVKGKELLERRRR
jgi:RNA polymerase-binding protein DksA